MTVSFFHGSHLERGTYRLPLHAKYHMYHNLHRPDSWVSTLVSIVVHVRTATKAFIARPSAYLAFNWYIKSNYEFAGVYNLLYATVRLCMSNRKRVQPFSVCDPNDLSFCMSVSRSSSSSACSLVYNLLRFSTCWIITSTAFPIRLSCKSQTKETIE